MYGGGPVCDLGVHIVDGIHLMAGAGFPSTVTARRVRSKVEHFDTAERAAIFVEYPNGLLVSLIIDGAAVAQRELSMIEGDGGQIEIDTQQTRGSIVRRNLDPDLHTATHRHLENFFESIRNAGRPSAPVSLVFPATLICQMANVSIMSQRSARWNSNAARVEMM